MIAHPHPSPQTPDYADVPIPIPILIPSNPPPCAKLQYIIYHPYIH